jgi:hypothetical protein
MRVAVDASDTRWTAPDAPFAAPCSGEVPEFFHARKNAMPLVWLLAFGLYFHAQASRWHRLERERR